MTCSVKLVASLLVFLGACRFNKVAGLKITTPQSCGNEFTLSDSQLSASSEWNKSHGAANAKLHHQGVGGRTEAWSTRHNNVNQWLQVDLRNISKVTRVTTQGRADANQWVKNYSIEYSLFGSHFVSYKVGGIEKVFKGNEDQDTEKSYKLSNPIIARYIRISPKSWNGHISMRVAFYGCTSGIDLPTPSCGEPLGLQSNAISDSQMTASSEWDVGHRAANARLNYHAGAGRTGAWSALYNNADQWLRVDFITMTKITKIATQGRQDSDQWLTSYTISYSMDGVFWKEYPEVFSGNSDRGTIVRHKFQQKMYARFLRIHPRTWHEHISLRAEVYGCTSGFQIPSGLFTCVNPLGMHNKTIPDSRITASSMWDGNHSPARARLGTIRVGQYRGAWSASTNDLGQWIQVDFIRATKVTRIAIQGREDVDQWVSSYVVQFSLDGGYFENYNKGRLLRGNIDRNSIVGNVLDPAIIGRYIRIRPKSWYQHISLRFELYGCKKGFDLPTPCCGEPLGLQSNAISDSQMTASSEWDDGHRAANARLNYHAGAGRTGAWSARYNNADQWLRVDFITMTKITKIATQGRQDSDQWLTSYTISYSMDGVFWKEYPEVFSGNSDRGTIVRHKFQQEIYARFLRIHPRTWHEHISLRTEVYGCTSGFQIPSRLVTCVNALGMQNEAIPDSRITASSMWDGNHSPARARLGTIRVGKYRGAWSASTNDLGQWIQVHFTRATKVTRIATQGRRDDDQWVSSYAVQYSLGGGYFEDYNKGRLLRGNIDRNSIVGNVLDPAIIGRYIRIRPNSWYGHISLRFELYGCKKGFDLPTPCCGEPLGLQSNAISDSQMTASSEWDVGHRAANARLNYHAGAGRTGAWSALYNNADQWLQVDFITMTKITKIATQGRQDSDQWLTSYTISYSMDGVFWKEHPEVFSGNSDQGTIVRHKLLQEIYARYLRIQPRTWHEHISLRAEVYGCTSGFQIPSRLVTCVNPLGMQNKTIPDSRITASSMWDGNHSPARARLGTIRVGQYRGAWSASTNDLGQWIQVDFIRATKVTRIATQGRRDDDQWVSSYAVQYSLDGGYFENYNKGRLLRGNIDRNSIVGNVLDPAIIGRYIRIRPKSWYGHISLRFELYGCKKGFDLPTPCCGEPLGLQSNAISDSQMTASSEWDVGHRAANARLNYHAGAGRTGAWSALYNNADQWLRVDFITMTKITKIATQGRQDSDQWLTSYTISYSIDDVFWKEYPEKVFSGNSDRETIVRHKFQQEIYARFLRIHPRTWHEHISLRVEIYGCTSGFQIPSGLVTCVNPLGMQNKTIPDSRITASSMWDGNHSPARARLGSTRVGKYSSAWSASTNDLGQWIQVHFIQATKVTRIATQGREDVDQWVSSYAMQFSLDGRYFENYHRVLIGNTDRNSMVGNVLDPAIIARYIRIRPKSWYEHISMRFEVYGCKQGFQIPSRLVTCVNPLGMQNKTIPDSRITASSMWNGNHSPARARLGTIGGGQYRGAWSASTNDLEQWIQVDCIKATKVTRIATQGREDVDQWVSSYAVQYSLDGGYFENYNMGRALIGNTDRNSIVGNVLDPAIIGRYIRILPKSWYGHISLRFELYGCKKSATK